MSAVEALALVTRLAAFAALLSSSESLVRLRWYREGGLMDWQVARLAQPWLTCGRLAQVLERAFDDRGLRGLLVTRIIAATALVAVPAGAVAGALAAFLLVTTCALAVRCSWGHDGADQMMVVIFGPVALAGLTGGPGAASLALWFIAGQLVLAYFVAGVAKLSARGWRDGSALPAVFTTRIYGHAAAARWLRRHPRLALAGAWGVIAFECLYPVVFVAPAPVLWILVATSLAFHLVAAVLMGLNTFLWAFVAAYPALLVVTA